MQIHHLNPITNRYEPIRLFAKQREILDCQARFIVVSTGRRFSKTLTGVLKGLQCLFNGQKIGWFAPTYQLCQTAMAEFEDKLTFLEEHYQVKLIKKFSVRDKQAKLLNGSTLDFQSFENKTIGRSKAFHLAIVDEAAHIPKLWERFHRELRPCLSDYTGRALFLSSPSGMNDFYRLFRMEEEDEDWKSFHATQNDNPYIPKEEREANNAKTDPYSEQEYKGKFLGAGICPFTVEALDRAIQPLSKEPTKVFGVDLGFKFDNSCIVGLDANGRLTYFKSMKESQERTKQTILTVVGKVPTLIDQTGIGQLYTQELQRHAPNIKGFVYSTRSREELLDELIVAVNEGKVSLNNEIRQEAERFEYCQTWNGRQFVAVPNSGHDDSVMALALANYHLRKSTQDWSITALDWRKYKRPDSTKA